MKTKSLKPIVKLLSFIAILLSSEVALSQSPLELPKLNEAVEIEVGVPSLSNLDLRWWQYFEMAATEETLNQRTTEFIQVLTKATQKADPVLNFDKDIAVIKELLNQYAKQKFLIIEIPVDEEQVLQESYSIQELIDLNTEKNQIIEALNSTEDEMAAITKNLSKTINQIDLLKISYQNITDEQIRKYQIALEWIDKRIRQALDDLRLERLNNKFESLNTSISNKEDLIAQASEKLVLNKSLAPIQKTEELEEKKAENQLKLDELNLKLAQDFANTEEAKLNYEINRLDLTLASIEINKYDLLINKNAQIVFLEQHIDNASVDVESLRELINRSDELLEQTEKNLDLWQETSQNTLLQPSLDLAKKPSKKIIQLDKSKRIKAQSITTESEHIRTIKNVNLFNTNLLKIKLGKVETGLSKVWNTVKSFTVSTVKFTKDLVYNPLFTINEYPVTLLPLIKLLLIILIGYLSSKIVSHLINRYEKKHKIDRTRNRSSLYLMHRLIHYFIIIIVTVTGLSTLGINLGNITLIAGALSVGIGFGLQNLVSNFVSGLTIMFEKTLSVGDYIELDDGTTGVIKEIRARSTRLNTSDNIDVIIPNSDMVTNRIINWTLKESIRRVKIPFGVAYGTDKELVKKAALEAATNVEYTLTNMPGKEPEVWMTEFGDNSVNFILLAWVAHYGLRRPNRMKNYFLWELDTSLRKYGIEIPFPQRDVHLNIVDKKDMPPTTDIILGADS